MPGGGVVVDILDAYSFLKSLGNRICLFLCVCLSLSHTERWRGVEEETERGCFWLSLTGLCLWYPVHDILVVNSMS